MIKIYGSSDDLIEVEGDLEEEFVGDNLVLGVSNGFLLRVKYDEDGLWRIIVLYKPPGLVVSVHHATDIDSDYSDVAVIPGNIEWVVAGKEFVR